LPTVSVILALIGVWLGSVVLVGVVVVADAAIYAARERRLFARLTIPDDISSLYADRPSADLGARIADVPM
jgi:hypothetical protein